MCLALPRVLSCPTLCDPTDCSLPGSPVRGIFHQEHLSGLPFPPPGDLPNPGREPTSPMSLVIVGRFSPLTWETLVSSVQFSQSCPTLCNPMNHSTPGLPVHHQLLEFIQTHVHRVGDAIQPSHPLSSPSPPAPNPSQYQGLFQ